jgi:hypothetical protein
LDLVWVQGKLSVLESLWELKKAQERQKAKDSETLMALMKSTVGRMVELILLDPGKEGYLGYWLACLTWWGWQMGSLK